MKNTHNIVDVFRKSIIVTLLWVAIIPGGIAVAQDWGEIGRQLGERSQRTAKEVMDDYMQSNDIRFYDPNDTSECLIQPGSATSGGITRSGNGANGNLDYKGRQIIRDDKMEKIRNNQPIYEEASKRTNIPWQILAVVHIRESNLADFNPPNGQGIYQNSLGEGGPYPEGPVSDAEFLRQTIFAAERLKSMAVDKKINDLVEKGDPEAIKQLFFVYNGTADAYTDQAFRLGFDKGYEGSPYVMNIADEKRDPEVNKTTWGQIKVDYGKIEFPAHGDYGAFIMYAALAGIPTSSSSSSSLACIGARLGSRAGALGWAVTGANAMQVYYQDEGEYATKGFGALTIKTHGCGPTSAAMAIATLNNDPSINPANMAQFFYDNGALTDVGTHFFIWDKVAEKYGVTFTNLENDLSKAADAVKRGSFVIISADGCPFACAGGHILLIRGVTESGKFLIADPNKNWATDSNKTFNEEGYEIKSAASSGIQYMWEIRKS